MTLDPSYKKDMPLLALNHINSIDLQIKEESFHS